MLNSVNHTGLTVASVNASLGFYRDTLGLAVDERRTGEWSGQFLEALTGYPGCHLRIAMVVTKDGSRIQLEEFVTGATPPVSPEWGAPGGGHLCVEVDDIFAVAEAVRRAGYEIISVPSEPVPLPQESVNAGGYMLGVHDPDGHVIELLQLPRHDNVAAPGS